MRLAHAANRGFDLVLSDFQMPDMDGAMLGERINTDPALSQARVVLLTSDGSAGRPQPNSRQLGFAGLPRRSRSVRASCWPVSTRCSSTRRRRGMRKTHPIVTTNSLSRGRRGSKPFSGKVLLVEDNIVNQKVGQRFLERLGCTVMLAENGQEAIDAWKTGRVPPRADGRADAGDGRLHRHPPDPRSRARTRAHAHRGAHRERHDRTTRTLPAIAAWMACSPSRSNPSASKKCSNASGLGALEEALDEIRARLTPPSATRPRRKSEMRFKAARP